MRISPINTLKIPQKRIVGFTSSDINSLNNPKNTQSKENISDFTPYMRAYLMLKSKKAENKNYSYKPIASTKPINDFVSHYDDLDKFSELYAKKINSKILTPTLQDIKNLTSRIKKTTKAPKNQIRQVLYNLTSFTNYNSFEAIQKVIKNENIKEFGFIDKSQKKNNPVDFSSNSALDYLAYKKHFINSVDGQKTAYVLDDISLRQLEMYKNSSDKDKRQVYQDFTNNIKQDKVVFLSIKGWDIKTKNNGYKNANMFSGTGYLEELAVEVIKRINEGENPKNIYYSDFKERLYKLFEDRDDLKEHINIVDIEAQDDKEIITDYDILMNVKPAIITENYVKNYVNSFLNYKPSRYSRERTQTALLKYLDEQANIYSQDSLSLALKKLNRTIESILAQKGYKKEDIIYLVPESSKSYSLITLMYSQINNIDPKNIRPIFGIGEEDKNKAKIILDDLSASGTSEYKTSFYYRVNYKDDGNTFMYAPVVLCSFAESSRERTSNSYIPDEYCFDKYINDMATVNELSEILEDSIFSANKSYLEDSITMLAKQRYRLLDIEDIKILNEILYKGYSSNALCVVFPYMIPDNSSDIASLLFGTLLYRNNRTTNKLYGFLADKQMQRAKEYKAYKEIQNEACKSILNV